MSDTRKPNAKPSKHGETKLMERHAKRQKAEDVRRIRRMNPLMTLREEIDAIDGLTDGIRDEHMDGLWDDMFIDGGR